MQCLAEPGLSWLVDWIKLFDLTQTSDDDDDDDEDDDDEDDDDGVNDLLSADWTKLFDLTQTRDPFLKQTSLAYLTRAENKLRHPTLQY